MGKASYKKFKKQEKARVKLKGNKTLLPKGQNITDTSFKVKKIVVKEQLKEHSENELLTRKHLSIKELIARLSHHNTSMRQDALSGLKELVTSHGTNIVQANLSPLLQAVMGLTVDTESDVRSDTLKLLSGIFDKLTEEELTPLFPVVVCHLTCAMTHIEPSVRADSLKLLDTMLVSLPTLTAAHTPTLLPHFLDLISQRGSGGGGDRTLSLHLDGRVTSEKWRGRVIGRLNRLFSVISDHSKKDESRGVRTMQWRADQPTYVSLYSPLGVGATRAENIANLPLQDYAKMLMPLLLDTFIEAVPKQDQEDSEIACVVGVDTAALLQSIVEVILHIWNLLKLSTQDESLTEWFVKTWGESVVTRLVRGRFPYSITAANSRKRQRESDQMLAALQVARDREPSCTLLNLQLCLLIFLLTPPGDLWNKSIQYIKRILRGGAVLKPESSSLLCECLQAASGVPLPGDSPSLLSVLSNCDILTSVDKPVNRKAFDFLTSVALMPSHHLHKNKHFTTWLDFLPALLCRPSVPLVIVRSIAAIATRKLSSFSNSLDGWAEEILGNLPSLSVLGDKEKEGLKLIVGLMYWVTDWDQQLAETAKQVIQSGSLGSQLTNRLVDILRLKIDNTDGSEQKNLVEHVFPK